MATADDDHPDKVAREKAREAFTAATDARKLEITLFWQRSLFFWGFISAAFVGFAALKDSDGIFRIPIASFGVVCSFAWCLVNRGSKYWHESWEQKVERVEFEATGHSLFKGREKRLVKHTIWNASERSVSRITMALSDFTFLIWIILLFAAVRKNDIDFFGALSILLSTVFLLAIYFGTTSEKSSD